MLLLTLRYLAFNWGKSVLLAICFALTLFLPMLVDALTRSYERSLGSRAEATPAVIGAMGDRYDLVLKSLYFAGGLRSELNAADWDSVAAFGYGAVIPLHVGFRAREAPVVGTTLDYFEFRGLRAAAGSLPLVLGDAAVGASAAAELDLAPGDAIITDHASLIDIAGGYPLKLRITGVLAPTGTPDDAAIFCDIKTAWTIAGIGHGHGEVTGANVLSRDERNVVASPAIVEYTEITEENIDSFHFHGGRESYPVSSLVVVPTSDKAATLLRGRMSVSDRLQLLIPKEIIDDLLEIIFKVKTMLDAAAGLMGALAVLFTTLVVLLSLRLRQREREILARIGCSRTVIFQLQAIELGILLAAGAAAAAAAALIAARIAPDAVHHMIG